MGTRSLDPGVVPAKNVRVYAQCMKDSRGGVTLMVLNMDKTVEALLKLPAAGKRYSLSSPDLFSQSVLLNGKELKAEPDGTIPALQGEASMPGPMTFPPLSITFVEMPSAGNPQCGR
jgi:heparanase